GMTMHYRSQSTCLWTIRSVCAFLFCAFWAMPAWAQETAGSVPETGGMGVLVGWVVALLGSICALVFAYRFYNWMKEQDEGDERMVEIAGYVRAGANAYLWRQYKVVFVFFVITSILLAIVAFVFEAQSG